MATKAIPFALLRTRFAELLALSAAARTEALIALDAAEPALAARLRGLLRQNASLDAAETTRDPAAHLNAGDRVGPYAIVGVLAQGGMGVVYRAARADGAYAQQVALKLMAPGLRDSAGLRQRFLRERQILARLEHPAIVHLLDGGVTTDGRLWLALELVDGIDLAAWVRMAQPDRRQRLDLFVALCGAVEHAHARQILHRDLKPANVLVDAHGRPRLLDFGIAGLLDDTDGGEARATRGAAMTVRYAAPEQVRQQHGTVATDVYALGVLLHELLCGGRSPYPLAQAGSQTWASAALDAVPQPLRQAVAAADSTAVAVDAELEAIVRHALEKDPARRYPTVAALREDVQDWQAGRPARSGIGGAAAQWRALLKRLRWPLAAAAAVLLALAGGIWLALREARVAREQAALAQANHQVLLEVLTSASPADYVGREPTASVFLSAAAQQIARRLAERPQAVWPALAEIANGLLNLSQPRAAEDALELALEAVARDTRATDPDHLMLWKLMAFAQSTPEAQARSARTVTRISALAAATNTLIASGERADTLATAAGLAARHGHAAALTRLLAQLELALSAATHWTPALAERVQRQRGLALLRANQPLAALVALDAAHAAIRGQPGAVSALREAELLTFRADARLLAGQVAGAESDFADAMRVLAAEFDRTHPERAALDLQQAELDLAQGRREAVRAGLDALRARLDSDAVLAPRLRRLRLALALADSDCPAARAVGDTLDGPDLRQQQAAQTLQARRVAACTSVTAHTP